MIINVDLKLLSTFIVSLVLTFLGFFVFLHDYKSATNRFFWGHTIFTIAWAIANYISINVVGEKVLFWIRIVLLLATQLVFLLFFFVTNFPSKKIIIPKSKIIFILLLMLIASSIILSPYGFKGIDTVDGKILPRPGFFMPVFSVILIGVSVFSFIHIIKNYLSAVGLLKKQWFLIGLGLITTYSFLLFFLFIQTVFFHNPAFVPYSPLFILPLFIFIGGAIIRYQLFNIKVAATELLIFVILIINLVHLLTTKTIFGFILFLGQTIFILIFGFLLIRSVLKEISTRKNIEQLVKKLEITNKQLKQVDKFKSEFLSIASHQLRTPLSILKGYLSEAREGDFGPFTETQEKLIEKLSVTTERLIGLVEELLDISRLEKGKVEYHFAINNIELLVKEIFEELKPKAESKKLNFVLNMPDKPLSKIKFDYKKMYEVIYNIIDNAIKYTEQGSVIVEVKQINSLITINVTDTGIGISTEELSKLFEKFFRGSRVSQLYTEGTGLGLYYAKKVVEDHQGKIYATSPGIGKGSTFHIELPTAI